MAEERFGRRSSNLSRRVAHLEDRVAELDNRLSDQEGFTMAAIDDLKQGFSDLVAEDGVIFAELDKLKAKGSGVSEADVQAASDAVAAELKRQRDKMAQIEPPAPSPAPAPATPPAARPHR